MLRRLLRTPRADMEIGGAIPVGCMLPLAIAAPVLVGVGVLIGTGHRQSSVFSDHMTVRVIDDGAPGGRQEISSQVAPLR